MCGIFGIYGHKNAALLTYLGLYALQHRGEESAGIVSYDGKRVRLHKGMGLVSDVFDEEQIKSLKGFISVGHTRYSTTGSSNIKNAQPFLVNHQGLNIAIAHNGNLTNTVALRGRLEENGSIFQTSMDSEIIAHLMARSEARDCREKVINSLLQLEGAFSLVMMIDGMVVGARDPYGFRPLCLGRLGSSYILASETCCLDLIHARYIRDVKPGEILFIDKSGIKSVNMPKSKRHAFCIFEYIYFARPDSNIFGNSVYLTRKQLGRQLAKECPADCDIAMPIPDSGNYAALGFSEYSKVPFEVGMIRNHYIGRTFIQPTQHIRDFRVKVKLNPIKEVIKGKRIAIVEDSIVRGTTSKSRVKTLREAGAKKIHMRISCPPIISPCFYGIDFPTAKELIASRYNIKGVRDFIGVDSLQYLSLEGMFKAMPLPKEKFCAACFTANYPTKLAKNFSKYMFEKNRGK